MIIIITMDIITVKTLTYERSYLLGHISITIAHENLNFPLRIFFKIKQLQNSLLLFVSGKSRFSLDSKQLISLV